MRFLSKARTLQSLQGRLRTAEILPLEVVSRSDWQADPESFLDRVEAQPWGRDSMVVRSSAGQEDTTEGSLAGHFVSVVGVTGRDALRSALALVAGSLPQAHDEIFCQPQLTEVACSGVAFSRDPNTGGPYFVVNYDDSSGSTTSVTSGQGTHIRTYLQAHGRTGSDARMSGPIALLEELSGLFPEHALDIEFATTTGGRLVLFQVRPLCLRPRPGLSAAEHGQLLERVSAKVEQLCRPHPYLHGQRGIFGVMPDWNPAEIIGVRPRPLALSLYRELVTDAIWAYQRDNYGYLNLRSFPLMRTLGGLPYIDVRVSFNSFIPKTLSSALAERLVDYYLDSLRRQPHLHDKVEFEVVFSCYTFDLTGRLDRLRGFGFSESELVQIADSLRALTCSIMDNRDGLWRKDSCKIEELGRRQEYVLSSELPPWERIYWLLEDCKRYGTLPFAGLARAGFIATQLLRSLVTTSVISEQEYAEFMASLHTITSRLSRDFHNLPRESFLATYGHLRPGTYDNLSPRYDEAPDRYFDFATRRPAEHQRRADFRLSLPQLQTIRGLLESHGLGDDVINFFDFVRAGIEGREFAKFVFSKSLSDAISLLNLWGGQLGFTPDDLSYLDIAVIRDLCLSSADPVERLRDSIARGRCAYETSLQLVLPPLICAPEDCFSFHLPDSEPNFVTQAACVAEVVALNGHSVEHLDLHRKIVCIPSADPGYDWIFSREPAGLLTQYGGVNSHMAIRAGELQLPAVIGAGDTLYRVWSQADLLEIDCARRCVRVLRGGEVG